MPARPSIAVLAAALALAAPTPGLAQEEPGAGASQDSDPFRPHPAQSQAQPPARAPTLTRTGFDVLPLAAAGVALLLAGLALWRRPHARR